MLPCQCFYKQTKGEGEIDSKDPAKSQGRYPGQERDSIYIIWPLTPLNVCFDFQHHFFKPRSLWRAWHPDGRNSQLPLTAVGRYRPKQGTGLHGGMEKGAPVASPPLLCASSGLRGAPGCPQGQTDRRLVSQSSVRQVRGIIYNLARQGEKTTTKAQRLERTRHVPKLQASGGGVGGTRSEVRAGPGAWALSCGKGKPLGLQRGHRGGRGAAGPRTRRPSTTSDAKAQREGTPGEGALSYPHATGRQEGPANPSCDDQGHEHAGQEGRPLR